MSTAADHWRLEGADRERTRALIESSDCFRRTPSRFTSPVAYKEWQHFLVHVPQDLDRRTKPLKLIVNFNLIDNAWAQADEAREVARVIVLAHSDQWSGVIEPIDQRDLGVTAGKIDADFGLNRLRWNGSAYTVEINLPQHEIQIYLTFTPQTIPGLAINQPLAPNLKLSWFFVPRLIASGKVSIGGHTTPVENALAYHDHNWAVFRWGDDFTWEWASILPAAPDCPWTFVLMRLTDRGRTVVRSQAVFVWHRAVKVRTFKDREMTVTTKGHLRVSQPFQIPPVMKLLTTGSTVDVPSHWQLEAGKGAEDDWLELAFDPIDLSQVVMPSETELEEVTILNEATGTVTARGEVAGHRVEFLGNGVFEFLRS